MADDEQTAIAFELARDFPRTRGRGEPRWHKAYFRFCLEGQKDGWTKHGSVASYVVDSSAIPIAASKHYALYESMNDKVMRLLALLGKAQGVALLVIDSSFHCDIKFEYEKLDRWNITKARGGTGIPEGL